MNKILDYGRSTLLLIFAAVLGMPLLSRAETREITFPVIGEVNFSDDFGAPRSGHTHEGNDLLGHKLQPLVAVVDGTVRYVAWPEPDYGYMVSLQDEAGYEYRYIHINNDTPGTDDGLGGGRNAYAPGIDGSYPVVAGQLIGWMGDSGNAENTAPHLHFEIRRPDGNPINPYESLIAADHISTPTLAPALPNELLPFGEFQGGSSLALGNINTTDQLELVIGAGPGGGPQVQVFTLAGKNITNFFAYDEGFRGGIDVAAGDVDGDGQDEIITGAGPGGGPQVRIFNSQGKVLRSFFAYDENFRGGINIAAADLNGDGKVEIITGPRAGGGPQVKVFSPRGKLRDQFMAYDPNFHGGIDVTAQAATTNRLGHIITGAGPGGGPQVRVFTVHGKPLYNFFAFDKDFHGGIRVSAEKNTIMVAPASQGSPDIRLFNTKGAYETSMSELEQWWTGSYDITIKDEVLYLASGAGGRRATVRRLR